MTHATRRGVLRAGTALAVGSLALGTPRRATAQESFGGWMEGVGNYDGVVDATGQSEVTITVGAEANGGAFGYEPAAVQVDTGTTVVWEWNGKGGQHNVVAESGADFESDLVGEAGHTFSWTPESETTATYFCTPHRSLGMKGAVVVGGAAGAAGGGESGATEGEASGTTAADGDSGGGTTPAAEGDDGSDDQSAEATAPSGGDEQAITLLKGGAVGAVLSPLLFGVFVKLAGRGEGSSDG